MYDELSAGKGDVVRQTPSTLTVAPAVLQSLSGKRRSVPEHIAPTAQPQSPHETLTPSPITWAIENVESAGQATEAPAIARHTV